MEANDIAELLRRWHAGDAVALDVLLERNLPFLRAHAHRQLGDKLRAKEQTDDVVQDAVIDFMTYGPPFLLQDEGHFRALMLRVIEHVLSGHDEWYARMRRDLRREHPLPVGTTVWVGAPSSASPSRVAAGHEEEAMLRLALEMLDGVDQRIVSLHTYRETTFAAIGNELGMTEDAVRMRFKRALAKLSAKVLQLKNGSVDEFLSG